MILLKDLYLKNIKNSNKAYNLSKLLNYGFNISNGYFISDNDYKTKNYYFPTEFEKIAIRSAGIGEDSLNNSFAGIFKSVLNIEKEKFEKKLKIIYNSFYSKKAKIYCKIKKTKIKPGILIQEMINSKYSAILFIEKEKINISFIDDYCNKIANGKLISNEYQFNLKNYKSLIKNIPLLQKLSFDNLLENLLDYIFKEKDNKYFIDIELTYSDNKWYILQYRKLNNIN